MNTNLLIYRMQKHFVEVTNTLHIYIGQYQDHKKNMDRP